MDDDNILKKDTAPTGFISTGVILANLAYSGRVDGGVQIGKMWEFAAPSKLGKTLMGLSIMKHAQDMGMFCVALDAEFVWDWKLAESFGISFDDDKLYVYQSNQIEEIQAKVMKIVNGLSLEDRRKIYFMFDSWGALISEKGLEKSQSEEGKSDRTESVKKNRLANFMMNTRSTFYIANSVYANISGYGDPVKVSGGTRIYHNCDGIIQGRTKTQEEITVKGEDVTTGTIIKCRIDKSRKSREYTEFDLRINFDGGLDIFYGLLDYAFEGGFVSKTDTGYHFRPHIKNDKRFREREIYTSDFWLPIFNETGFIDFIEEKFKFKGKMTAAQTNIVADIKRQEPSAPEAKIEEKAEEK
jgi:hypothetical protein